MPKPSLSLCMIVRDESAGLDACLSSIVKYVDELIVVDTGSNDDGATKRIALAHGAQVFDFNQQTNPEAFLLDDEKTECPPPYSGEWILSNFAAARQFSFSKATKDFILWIDADDTVEGAEKIPEVMTELATMGPEASAWFRYDYSFQNGKPNCQLWRERILKRGSGKWLNPIHEIHEMVPGTVYRHFEQCSIHHHRDLARPRAIANRNYKVLKQQYNRTKDTALDARTLFYLGNEAKFINPEEAIGYYEQYLRLSGWDEERSVARIFLGQIHEGRGDMEAALKAYSSATVDFPQNPDPWFSLGRLAYLKEDWAKCAKRIEKGLELGNPVSPIMYNPLERAFAPHQYYNVALSKLHRLKEAIASCDAALAIFPEDGNLKYNRKLYSDFLAQNPDLSKQPTVTDKKIQISDNPLMGEPNLPPNVTTAMALQVWREMLRFGEIVRAKEYLDSLPSFMAELPEVKEVRAKTVALLEWAKTKAPPEAFNSVAPDVALDDPTQAVQSVRWTAVRINLPVGSRLRILDVGCQDGWISNRLALLGHSVVGIGTNAAGALTTAREHASRLKLDSTFVDGTPSQVAQLVRERFDVVVYTESIERVIDVRDMMHSLHNCLKSGGKVIVTTPNKSAGTKWDEPRDAVRNYTPASLGLELARFFEVGSLYTRSTLAVPDASTPSCLVATGIKRQTPPVVPVKKLNIVIWAGAAVEWWSPDKPHTTGIGGSETACIRMANELSKLGHRVRVYCDCPYMDGIYDGVEYTHFGAFNKEEPIDVFVSSRQPHVALPNINAKVKLLWVHDVHVGNPDPGMHEALLKFDRFLCLSQWHKQFFLETYKFVHPDSVVVTRNGIDLERFRTPALYRQNKLIYTSSPNRGLELLLDLMPKIVERVPDVELGIYYGFESWESSVRNDPGQQALIAHYKAKILATKNVKFYGRKNQGDLAKAFQAAKVWAYPTWFTETSCITAMEAQAAGCVPVVTGLAALRETVAHGIVLPHPVDSGGKQIAPAQSPEFQAAFVDRVCELLQDEPKRYALAKKGMTHARSLSWAALATDWVNLFERIILEVESDVVTKFQEVA